MQLFFGYVENYALYMPGLLLYLHLGMRALQKRVPLYIPALLLGVLLALHRAFAVFGPSLLFLAYHDWRNRQHCIPSWKYGLTTVAALCCAPVSAYLFMWLSDVNFDIYVGGTGGDELLPLFAKSDENPQDGIFSLPHFLDFAKSNNCLSAPVACMVFVSNEKKKISVVGRFLQPVH